MARQASIGGIGNADAGSTGDGACKVGGRLKHGLQVGAAGDFDERKIRGIGQIIALRVAAWREQGGACGDLGIDGGHGLQLGQGASSHLGGGHFGVDDLVHEGRVRTVL